MSATRQDDERLVDALHIIRAGRSLRAAAMIVRKDPSNLSKSIQSVLRDDLESGDDHMEIVSHYPRSMVTGLL